MAFNLLTVSVIATGKKRLNLDLRSLEATIKSVLFEYAFIWDFMFVWDLMCGCHHLDLFAGQQLYFGFPFDFQSRYAILT